MKKKPDPDSLWKGLIALWFFVLLVAIAQINYVFSNASQNTNLDISSISFPISNMERIKNPEQPERDGQARQDREEDKEIEETPKGEFIAKVSWYDYKYDGINCDDPDCITASGEAYNPEAFTTACWAEYPFGTTFRICRLDGSKCVVARCSDRGNFKRLGKFLDLSKASFRELWDLSKGVSEAKITIEK